MNKLEVGMRFKNTKELCEYLKWSYDNHYTKSIRNEFSKYANFHMNKNEIIVDKIISKNIPYFNCIPHKISKNYMYDVGSIIKQNTTFLKILEKVRIKKGKGTCKGYKIECLKCGYIFENTESRLKSGIGCPCCSGRIVVVGINDINSTNKELSSLLLNYEDGYNYTQYSSFRLDFRCKICGAIHKNKVISSIATRGLKCPCCNQSSYPNRFMFWFLTENNVTFYNEKSFSWSDSRKYDFYIPKFDMIIEMHGSQHYKDCSHFTRHSLEYEQENDLYKKDLAIKNGIKNYIVINSSKSDFNYIKENIINSELLSCLNIDITNLNWNNIAQKSNENILKEIAFLWNSGFNDTCELSKIVGLSQEAISSKLHKCEQYNLIEKYDKSLTMQIGRKKTTALHYQKYSKPIMCNENLMCFGNISICEKIMNETTLKKFYRSSIAKTIDGRYKQTNGYTFSYISKKQFNIEKEKFPDLCFGDFFIEEN